MRFAMMVAAGVLAAATAGIAHGEQETGNRGLSIPPNSSAIEGTIGVCLPVVNRGSIDPVDDERGYYALSVVDHAAGFYAHNPGEDPAVGLEYGKSVVTVLSPPRHGTLENGPGVNDLSYHPDATYTGNDKAVFLVEQDNHQIKVVYFLKVVRGTDSKAFHSAYKKYCPPPGWWKISLPTTSPTRESQPWRYASMDLLRRCYWQIRTSDRLTFQHAVKGYHALRHCFS